MTNKNKNFKIYGIRAQLIGDTIMALPILNYLEKIYPNSFKYWSIAKKTAQASQLYKNHPLIDEIHITQGNEGPEGSDFELINNCDLIINVNPQHPDGRFPNDFNIYEETFRMAGFDVKEFHNLTTEEQRPKLNRWFQTERNKNTIGIWPCAGYGTQNKRNPSREWYSKLIKELLSQNYTILQFGHPIDYKFDFTNSNYKIATNLSFFDQIKLSLSTDLNIGTDSGSSLVIGAYEHPQITLLTNHWPGHSRNFTALAPNSINNINFIGINNPDNINIEEVLEKIKELC
jgi:ADP-heptose:LPS heptosyltransferase